MSTYLYLECLDHDPPLQSQDESGQHTYDLLEIRADLNNRARVIVAFEETYAMGDSFRQHTAMFLVAHKTCRIGIVDEYGAHYNPEAPCQTCGDQTRVDRIRGGQTFLENCPDCNGGAW